MEVGLVVNVRLWPVAADRRPPALNPKGSHAWDSSTLLHLNTPPPYIENQTPPRPFLLKNWDLKTDFKIWDIIFRRFAGIRLGAHWLPAESGARKRPKADIVVIGVYEAENKEKNLETN